MIDESHREREAKALEALAESEAQPNPRDERRKSLLETLKDVRQPNLAMVREVLIFLLEGA
jgi:hypothetical protein